MAFVKKHTYNIYTKYASGPSSAFFKSGTVMKRRRIVLYCIGILRVSKAYGGAVTLDRGFWGPLPRKNSNSRCL